MCGISGAWGQNNQNIDALEISKAMRKALHHRGPDSYGDWVDDKFNLALSHARLSIIDLSDAGHQPMISPNGKLILSFNGEIYNHEELRELVEKYHSYKSWRGNSDIESFLAHLEFFGLEKTLKLSKGMFSFALWDQKERSIKLVRDRFGEKPLYWSLVNQGNNKAFIFASELVALIKSGCLLKDISIESLNDFLTRGYIQAPKSIYKKVFQLEPGSILSLKTKLDNKLMIDFNSLKIEKWWKNIAKFKPKKINKRIYIVDEYINIVEKKIQNAVKLASKADVPLCCFLSGGVDSSLISLSLQKNQIKPINTVNISFDDSGLGESSFNEKNSADLVAKHLKSNHKSITLTSKDIQQVIPQIATIYSEPFSDSSQLPTILLCRYSRELGYKVALSGDGGDELFGGYNRHKFIPKINYLFKNFPSLPLHLFSKVIDYFPVSNNYLNFDKRQKLARAIKNAYSLDKIYNNLINQSVCDNVLLEEKQKNSNYIDLPNAPTISEQIMMADLENYLPSDLLVKIDRAAMAVGLETRAPLLDYEIAELAWKLPLEMKIKNGKGKWILRRILSKYFPEEIHNKPKKGFAVPLGIWLRGPLKTWVSDLLSESTIKKQGYLNHHKIKIILDEHFSNKKDNSAIIWSILMWQSWLIKYKM